MNVGDRPSADTQNRKPRILIYVQDSWGLGHIQRVSKLARALQNAAECLILCGHREAGWIVPEGSEYIRIPSLNVPLSKGSGGTFWVENPRYTCRSTKR
jgi:predicted glycosyltransferase